MSRIVLIVGAGATLSDATGRTLKFRPPLDRGFFRGARAGHPELQSVTAYMQATYGVDPTDERDDSLEQVMSVLYSDINSGTTRSAATAAFRDLLGRFLLREGKTVAEDDLLLQLETQTNTLNWPRSRLELG